MERKLRDIITSRGKKGTDRHENAEQLAYIATIAKCPAQEAGLSATTYPLAFRNPPS